MKIMIGLTGPTGAGKSTLTQVAEGLGFRVIDCDLTARTATEKGKPGLDALTKVFGQDILNSDGTLNRVALAQKAFATKEATELLNITLLPYIAEEIKLLAKGDRIVLDAPTLFESGMNAYCCATVAVLADKQTRLERIISRDQIDLDAATLRMNAGKPDEFYKQNADYILYNNDGDEKIKNNYAELLQQIIKENEQ